MRYLIFILAFSISLSGLAQTDSHTSDTQNNQTVDNLMKEQLAATHDSLLKEQQKLIQENGKAVHELSQKSIEILKEQEAEKDKGINKDIIIGIGLLAGIIAVAVRSRKEKNKSV